MHSRLLDARNQSCFIAYLGNAQRRTCARRLDEEWESELSHAGKRRFAVSDPVAVADDFVWTNRQTSDAKHRLHMPFVHTSR